MSTGTFGLHTTWALGVKMPSLKDNGTWYHNLVTQDNPQTLSAISCQIDFLSVSLHRRKHAPTHERVTHKHYRRPPFMSTRTFPLHSDMVAGVFQI